MKWHEYEKNNPKPLYTELRVICEEIHSQGGFFCNYCYQREGWYCFPCDKVRKIHEKRDDAPAGKLLTSSKKDQKSLILGGAKFWK